MNRPRFLLPLALLTFLYGSWGVLSSWMTVGVLTSDHDSFVTAARDSAGVSLGIVPQVGSTDEQRQGATREAEAIWARRNALVPLAICDIIASTLMLIGAMRALRRSRHSAWGCSAWQLGALLSLPCIALDSVIDHVRSRDLIVALVNAHDPVSNQLREQALAIDRKLIERAVMLGVYLVSVAIYLQSQSVKRWVSEGAGKATA